MTADQPSQTPHIRGEERLALIEDLALKDLTLPASAAKYNRHRQSIAQFSARNSAEIATRRQTLLGEVDAEAAHLWISDRVTRRAWRQKLIDDMEAALEDPELDWRQRSRYSRDIAMLLRQVDEEKGELPTRVALQVESVPKMTYEIGGVDMAGLLAEWHGAGRNPAPAPTDSERDGLTDPEPERDANVRPFRAFGSPDSINTRLSASDGSPPAVAAARQLAVTIWASGEVTTPARLGLSVDNPALTIATACEWVVVGEESQIHRGRVDPRPATVTAIPN